VVYSKDLAVSYLLLYSSVIVFMSSSECTHSHMRARALSLVRARTHQDTSICIRGLSS
jgi:hypothetical protein